MRNQVTKIFWEKEPKGYKKFKKEQCEFCGFRPVHYGQLDVDHIDGNHNNNKEDNLQTLCANCHRLKTITSGLKILETEKHPNGNVIYEAKQCSLSDKVRFTCKGCGKKEGMNCFYEVWAEPQICLIQCSLCGETYIYEHTTL